MLIALIFALSIQTPAHADPFGHKLHCSLKPEAVIAAEAPMANIALAAVKRFVLAKFPGASFSVGTPTADLSDTMFPMAIYPVSIRTRAGQSLGLVTEWAPQGSGLQLPTQTKDTGFLSRCAVTAQSQNEFKLPIDVVDNKGHVLAKTSFGSLPPQPPRDDGPRGCLIQCPADDVTGLPGQCDPSLLCDPTPPWAR